MEQVDEVAATDVEGDRDVTTRTTRTIITRTTYGGGDGEPSLAGWCEGLLSDQFGSVFPTGLIKKLKDEHMNVKETTLRIEHCVLLLCCFIRGDFSRTAKGFGTTVRLDCCSKVATD
uniref:Uncharacterized protein n=1 Tax=Parascaris equorum TaxID=6256 RepID=A0A914RTL2_PAREQ